jgi:DNA-binding LacI/PurR family transcriptional regulator
VSARYREGLREQFAKVCARHGVPFGHYYETAEDRNTETGEAAAANDESTAPTEPPQMVLALNDTGAAAGSRVA